MKTASDVNAIFAYGDSSHIFHQKVCSHMTRYVRNHYLLLAKVKSHFIFTYSRYLKDCFMIIDKSIREHRDERKKSPSKTYKPSHLAISANVNSKIDKYLNLKTRECNFSAKGAKTFINKLLTEHSIPSLFESDESFGEFREKYLFQSEERALEILNKFLNFFNKFELMYIEHYKNYEEWLKKIDDSPQDIFESKTDLEDIRIAAEFLSYTQEKGKIDFFTSDYNMGTSLVKISNEHSLVVGKIKTIKLKN